MVVHVTFFTFENLEVRPHLPVDFSPGYPVGLSDKCYEFLEIPRPINDMLGSNLTVIVDVSLTFGAVEYLSLAHCEQFVTKSALIQVVPFLLEQQLQFLHEKPTY